uniref:Sulfite reductase n=1 Tax=Desulfobacca acetoxidans TaxID=60893 RepID=A0A7V4LDJ1_9BACT
MALPKEELVEFIYKMVEAASGKKQLKAKDIEKEVLKKYPDQPKNDVKFAIKELIDGGRCVYTYFGGSFVEIPRVEGAAKH